MGYRVALLDDDGKLPPEAIPEGIGGIPGSLINAKADLIVGGSTGSPTRLPVGGSGTVLTADPAEPEGVKWGAAPNGGGEQCAAFAFSGTLTVRTGVLLWESPSRPIRLTRMVIVLGTLPTGVASVTARLMVNAAPNGTLTIGSVRRASTTLFPTVDIPAQSLLSMDITEATATGTVAGDAVVQVWWEYA